MAFKGVDELILECLKDFHQLPFMIYQQI